MGFLKRLLVERRAHPSNAPTWLREWLGGGSDTIAGKRVNEETAMNFLAVYGCVRNISEDAASLPFPLNRRLQPRGKERAPQHRLYRLLHDAPNSEISSFQWRQTQFVHVLLWGNLYAEIEVDAAGDPLALWPLTPKRVTPERINKTGPLVYRIATPNGEERILPARRVFHMPGLSFNGVTGLSPIGLMREAIGLGLAAEEYGSRFFSQDARPGGYLEHPQRLSDPAYKRLKEEWEEGHQGLTKAHRMDILEEGMKFHEVGIPPEDAQFLQTRRFQIEEIARAYRMPPHMIADLERTTFTNIEHQGIEYVVYTLRPWLVRFEQAVKMQLLSKSDQEIYFPEFLVDGLLRGDFATRMQGYQTGRNMGLWSADDVREMENQNPLPSGAGATYLHPLNMTIAAPDGLSVAQRWEAVGAAVRAGFDPTEALKALGLPAIKHLGLPPVTLQVDDDGSVRVRSERRSLDARQRIAHSYRGVFEEAAARIVRRESADVTRAVDRLLGQRDAEQFMLWLEEFYAEHEDFVRQQLTPPLTAYAEAAHADAADDVGLDPAMGAALDIFVGLYITNAASRWTISSRRQLQSVAAEAIARGEDPAAAIRLRLEEWEERRPGKLATRELVQERNAIAREVYQSAGRRSRWAAAGKSCPYCSSLDGRSVGGGEAFLNAGDPFQPDGVDAALVPSTGISHPPAHAGCECAVVPD
jgi:HK97 family phage portal protein